VAVFGFKLVAFSFRSTKFLFELSVGALDVDKLATSLLKLLGDGPVLGFEVVVGFGDYCERG